MSNSSLIEEIKISDNVPSSLKNNATRSQETLYDDSDAKILPMPIKCSNAYSK